MNIIQGESATIVYATVNATSVTVSNGVGSVSTNGSFVVSPTTTTSYTITAANAGGSTTCSVSVQVTPDAAPQIIRFTANPTSITHGATSTLVWQVQNATTVTITPGINSVPLIGTQDVTPQQTQTYTLTATNSYGSVNATATITVTPPTPPPVNNPPSITSFTANPPVSPSPGSPVVLTCLAKNASSVSVSVVAPASMPKFIGDGESANDHYLSVHRDRQRRSSGDGQCHGASDSVHAHASHHHSERFERAELLGPGSCRRRQQLQLHLPDGSSPGSDQSKPVRPARLETHPLHS